jgi:5-methylcytosine-specific restriction endonuclease McrA
MEGSRFSLWYLNNDAFKRFLKEKKQTKESAKALVNKAFPSVGYAENRFVKVKADKSPFDGDIIYWSKRNSVLYDGATAKALKKQNHTCGYCALGFVNEEKVHLHHVDGNHNNWKPNNLLAVHESCHDYIHMNKSES